MTLFRARLRLDGPLGTALTSGTLFGHLCWAYRARRGEAALGVWLRDMRAGAAAPFLVSDGVPHDLLPRPLLRPVSWSEDLPTAESDRLKRQRRLGWITRASWLKVRIGLSASALPPLLVDWRPQPVRQAHNRIDRLTGGTPEVAGLWFIDDDWSFSTTPDRDLYLDTDLPDTEVADLLADVGEQGYGRDSTYGRGRWRLEALAADPELEGGSGDRLLSLSHGCLDPAMADARWERWTHFGKVGAEMAMSGARPFKRPVLLMKPGATWAAGPGPFGRLLDGVHQDRPEIIHNAWHLAIPYREAA
ncbi:MAG: hypothetical protein U1E45_16455 [Geminicoccaceae bacterium]